MKFLNNWTILVEKLPTYPSFKANYEIDIDKRFLETIYTTDADYLTTERKAMLKNVIDKVSNNVLKVKHAQRCKGVGRFYADNSISLICLSRHIKHTIFHLLGWVDIDMVKGHPTIIYEVAKKNGNEGMLLNFKKYLQSPETIFQMLIEYYKPSYNDLKKQITYSQQCECVKQIFNIAIYGGTHNTWIADYCEKEQIELACYTPHTFVDGFIDDCVDICNLIYRSNPELVKRIKGDLTKEHDLKRRTMSYWCGAIENEILHICYKYLQKEKVITHLKNVLLEYDGLCFKSEVNNDILLNHLIPLNEKIKKDTGLAVLMTFKNYKPEYIHQDIIDKYNTLPPEIVSIDDSINELKLAETDNEASSIIFQELKEVLKAYKGRLFYFKDYIWSSDKDEIDTFVLNYILNSNIYYPAEKKPIPFCQNITKAKHVREVLYNKVYQDNNDPDLYIKFHTTTKGLLCFNDGVLNFKNKTFTLWKDISPNTIFSSVKINRNYHDYFLNPDEKVIADIRKGIFEPLFGDKTDVALHFLSRALAGHNEDKRWSTYLGNRNCGKGVIYDLLKSGFQDYVSTFELGNLLYCRKTAGTENIDCSKKLYWTIDLEFVRLAVSQEIPDHQSGLMINSKLLKKITGGGDEIVARRNFDRKDTHLTLDTTLALFGNNSAICDNDDCFETCIQFSSTIQFKTQEEIDTMIAEKRDADEMKRYKVSDPDIKEKCCTVECSNAVIYLIMSSYKNIAVPVYRSLDLEENDLYTQLKERFEFTYNENDIMLCTRVQEILYGFDKGKIATELSNINIHKKKSRIRNATYNKVCFFGLKEKVDNSSV